MKTHTGVRVWTEETLIPTYLPAPPDKNPMFLEKRVYQGSNGKVYPLPFTDRISETKTTRSWKTVWLENEYLRVMVLPELGGRIHAIQDRTNGYDLIYRQPVIKPALVGLAGPWVSGGIEFNWPQHHRPATFMPVEFRVEEQVDGSKTLWCGDHDPMARMKGMHGVCLRPGKSFLELKVRAHNRTPFAQTFLWWANVATRVHEGYQSFFPPDVYYIADHARRATSEYPLCQGSYYGVDYGERGRRGTPKGEFPTNYLPPNCGGSSPVDYVPNDLSFYANIPTPCSYMCMGSKEDFFGGYDHSAKAGLIHYASHHISPGKKQWTWGNHEFGYAWDRNLTDADSDGAFAPYIEIMAGVYTDNQPDFSFLKPGETKTWSQYWYPIQRIGPAHHANLDAAVSVVFEKKQVRVGVSVTSAFPGAVVRLDRRNGAAEWNVDLAPDKPFVLEGPQAKSPWRVGETTLRVLDREGREIICYSPTRHARGKVPPPATEPPAPEEMASADELYVTGLHLEQYRHATRCPTLYWREALRRDPLDARCNNAMGLWHLRRGDFAAAETHFRNSIERLTRRNPNPRDGEAFYNLGLCLRYQLDGQPSEPARDETGRRGPEETGSAFRRLFQNTYAALYKATWDQAWAGAAYHSLAELDCRGSDWPSALDHLTRSLRLDTDNLRARNLKAVVLRKLDREREAADLLHETLAIDPLDAWARHLAGHALESDLQTRLDLAHDHASAGLYAEAVALLDGAVVEVHDLPDQSWGAMPMVMYTLGWLSERLGDGRSASRRYKHAARLSPDYCFPARLEEIAILESAIRSNPGDARASYYLGNLLYDRRRHVEAMALWQRAAAIDPTFPTVWRNLGIGYFNVLKQPAKARAAYEKAFKAHPADPRLLYERDQLWKRLGESPDKRLRELERFPELVRQRDDLSVELCALYNQTGLHAKALALVGSRRFQPWEGGEGGPLGQHARAHMALGCASLREGNPAQALAHYEAAATAPRNLGEARHLLSNQSDVQFWLGCALDALGERARARQHWLAAANFEGDFQQMRMQAFSEMTYYSALSWKALGNKKKADRLLDQLLSHARSLARTKAAIDYFATSLPAMLLFDADIQFRQETEALFLQAQAHLGLGNKARARSLVAQVLKRDPNHPSAADLKRDLRSRVQHSRPTP